MHLVLHASAFAASIPQLHVLKDHSGHTPRCGCEDVLLANALAAVVVDAIAGRTGFDWKAVEAKAMMQAVNGTSELGLLPLQRG